MFGWLRRLFGWEDERPTSIRVETRATIGEPDWLTQRKAPPKTLPPAPPRTSSVFTRRADNGYSTPERRDDPTSDLLNPLNPLSPLSPIHTHSYDPSPVVPSHSDCAPAYAESPSQSSHYDGGSYDSGSSSFDSGGGSCGGGGGD